MDLKLFHILLSIILFLVSVESDPVTPQMEIIRDKCNVIYPSEDQKSFLNNFFFEYVANLQFDMNTYMANTELLSITSCLVNKLMEELDKFNKCLSEDIEQCSPELGDKFIDLFLFGEAVTPYDPNTCSEPASLELLHQNYQNNMVSISYLKDCIYNAPCEEVVQKALVYLCTGAEIFKHYADPSNNIQFILDLPAFISLLLNLNQKCYT